MDLGLKDKRAWIAGSSRGLGYATALLLAREGCQVVLNSREEEQVKAAAEAIAKGTGTQAHGVAGDVSDAATAEVLVTSAVEALGGLDILVSNAPSGYNRPVMEQKLKGWDWTLNINARALLVSIRASLSLGPTQPPMRF